MITNLIINKSIIRLENKLNNHYISEFNLKHFWKTRDYGPAISKLNRKFYKIRKQNHNKASLEEVTYNKKEDVLNLLFKVTPTFSGGVGTVTTIDLKGKETERSYYTVIIQFRKIKEVIGEQVEWNRLSPKEKREFIRDLIKFCDVKFHSNDASFLYQGAWKILSDLDSCVFPFPSGLTDKGIWSNRHGNNGIHLTKHLINVFNTLLVQSNITKVIKGMDNTYE